jgi:hypothetical protein
MEKSKDAPDVLGCDPGEIAWGEGSINDHTRAYIGPLFPGIFTLKNLEHIYTSFPEGKIYRESVTAGGKTGLEYGRLYVQKGIEVRSSRVEEILKKEGYITLEKPEQIDLIRLRLEQTGLLERPSTPKFLERVGELGLGCCPYEVGLEYPLQILDFPKGGVRFIGIEPVAPVVKPEIFEIANPGGFVVGSTWENPRPSYVEGPFGRYRIRSTFGEGVWDLSFEFVFRLPKQPKS